jgi:hypothetical protein
METPPPFSAPRRRGPSTVVIILIVAAVLCVCCGVLGGGAAWFAGRTGLPMMTCAMNAAAMQEALKAYARDNEGSLPLAENWQDALAPYYEQQVNELNQAIPFAKIEVSEVWGCNQEGILTGFAYNSEVAGKKLEEAGEEIIFFEVARRERNLAMAYEPQPVDQSPKIMNDRRGWFVVPATGSPKLLTKEGEQTFDVNQ